MKSSFEGQALQVKALDDIRASEVLAYVHVRGFPRFWRKHFAGVRLADAADGTRSVAGIALTNAHKGGVVQVAIRGIIRPRAPVKRTRLQRAWDWALSKIGRS